MTTHLAVDFMPSTVSFTVRANITGTSEVHVGVLWFLGAGCVLKIVLVMLLSVFFHFFSFRWSRNTRAFITLHKKYSFWARGWLSERM